METRAIVNSDGLEEPIMFVNQFAKLTNFMMEPNAIVLEDGELTLGYVNNALLELLLSITYVSVQMLINSSQLIYGLA